MNPDSDGKTPKSLVPTYSLKSRPTLDPFLSSKSSLEDALESGSSRPLSLATHEVSAFSDWSSQSSNGTSQQRAQTNNVSTLNRRNTKDLVNLFEKRSLGETSAQATSQPLQRDGLRLTDRTTGGGLTKSKPLRESFRHLVLAFNKAKRTLGDSPMGLELKSRIRPRDKEEIQQTVALSPKSSGSNGLAAVNMPAPTLSHVAPSLPQDIRSGIVLFYNDSTASWHRCNAFLAPPNLRLSYFLTSGKLVTLVVPVGTADDARSATVIPSTTTQPPLLDGNAPHVFEVQFANGTINRFAAPSVLERGGWVSAIWDAIISWKCTPQSNSLLVEDSTPSCLYATSPYRDGVSDTSSTHESAQLNIPPVLPLRTKSSKSSQSRWSSPSTSIRINNSNTTQSVMQRVAYINSFSDTPMNPTDAYVTPPRTPPPSNRRQSHQANLSKQVALRNLSTLLTDQSSTGPSGEGSSTNLSHTGTMDSEEEFPNSSNSPVSSYISNDTSSTAQALDEPQVPRKSPKVTFHNIKAEGMAQGSSSLNHILHSIRQGAQAQAEESKELQRRISAMQKDVKLAIQQPPLPVPQLDDLRDRLEALANGLHSADLHGLHAKVDSMQRPNVDTEQEQSSIASNNALLDEVQQLTKLVEGIGEQQVLVKPDMEHIKSALEKMQEQLAETDVPPPVPAKDNELDPIFALQETLQTIQNKLTAIEALVSGVQEQNPEPTEEEDLESLSVFRSRSTKSQPTESVTGPIGTQQPEIFEILSIVKEERDQRVTISEQFGDSVRYLNELNTWMEAFVTKTAGHEQLLQAISSTLDKLSGMERVTDEEGEITELHNETATEAESKREVLTELKAALSEFTNAIQELKNAHDANNLLATIEKNRTEQEALLRHIAEELSVDIRGDRLRFVEAMREATTINVSIHLDEFKRRLSEEVSAMLHDVGRMARDRERKYLEQEIQDIFRQQQQQQHYHSQSQLHLRYFPHQQQPHPPQHLPLVQQVQADGRRSSMGFQPLPPRSIPPSRPASEGPYPAFMMPPPASRAAMHTPAPVPLLRPMPLHPDLMRVNNQRPLPTPTGSHPGPVAPLPAPTSTPQDAILTRRKA
ncbi:hypothetical protein FRC17_001773 [Serendipita sp. 399]|nr:hypothetical protein FRC17_001773 [Serendipita sp. 399]